MLLTLRPAGCQSGVYDLEVASVGFSFFCGIILNVYIRTDNIRYRKEILMPDDVATLETQRSQLLGEFLRLGDLRPGSITAVTRRCGKPSCHCAKHNDSGMSRNFVSLAAWPARP